MDSDLFADGNAVDNDVFNRNVLMHTAAPGFNLLDAVYNVHAFNNFGKNAVAPAVHAFRTKVQEVIVDDVNKNCAVAEWGAEVRAMASVPRLFFKPLLASFLMVAFVSF